MIRSGKKMTTPANRLISLPRRVPVRSGFLPLLTVVLFPAAGLQAEEAIRLQEAFPPGYQYHVSCRVDVAGLLTLPAEKGQAGPKTLAVTGNSAIEYDERVLRRGTDGQVLKTARLYRRIDFERKVG